MRISVKNIGPIARGEIDISQPLTIFAGPSNSGKSYMATILYALMQSTQQENRLGNLPPYIVLPKKLQKQMLQLSRHTTNNDKIPHLQQAPSDDSIEMTDNRHVQQVIRLCAKKLATIIMACEDYISNHAPNNLHRCFGSTTGLIRQKSSAEITGNTTLNSKQTTIHKNFHYASLKKHKPWETGKMEAKNSLLSL